ncbi:peptidoglycan DD-metalloendopeptidase family protein [Glutamicibacter protophormiae]|uniref:peptidoglycan DD-metalloendopeptidase family protein n=1 Tax=Glutamicibacter protophormiae TaxID=37930 RepID=UPI002A7EF569|nr:peptidoglycan DD-metalloendopeptidase family protein [Glutamicibacter protophormiae]WPR64957.1 peptidoglycan DD-metalloendopeptidase family protein [Glutamicibacter protophormiae]WPR68453.1 peptidoglycan DD-metalloendopeptidase family protein [Glutamicibacter protophormiae]
MIWGISTAAALVLSSAVAIPLVAQSADPRNGDIPIAIDALSDPGLYNDPVLVSQDAPLHAFGGSGKEVAIDGRPLEMLAGADESPVGGDSGSEEDSTLLAGEVGQIGELPGGLQLMHPVTTRRISSPYGWRSNPTGAGNQIHIGQDYPIACGSPVYAAEAGTVTVSGWAGHSGMRVGIDHGSNVQTGYSHNSKLIAAVGQEVKQGELIALSGTTGNSTGCHVHFEVIVDGRWHDPRNYLPIIPGQGQAMIDSSRLTVNANSAPRGDGGKPPVRDESDLSSDPDVVVPKDDTPVVPKPKPSAKPSAKPKPSQSQKPAPSPSQTERPGSSAPDSESPSAKPSSSSAPSESGSESPSGSAKPTGEATPPTEAPSTGTTPSKKPTSAPGQKPGSQGPSTSGSGAAESN